VSAASTWEIAIKAALGRIQVEPAELVDAIEGSGFSELAVRIGHTARVRSLPLHRRDLFDRVLMAKHSKEE
jgi:PIN domain nuclease of toxin-antitoxin system